MVQKYFNQLNYTLGNEDTSVDVELVKRLGSKDIFSIAGCGGRCFPLLATSNSLCLADVSAYQLSLCRLREALYRSCDFHDFLRFFDYPPYHAQDNNFRRREIFSKLNLTSEDHDYFKGLFESLSWKSLLYVGKWEKTFQTMSKGLRIILGKNYNALFDFHDLNSQKSYFTEHFDNARWKSLLFLLGNKSVFNALLYKGDFIEKNVEQSHFDYYKESFDRLFNNSRARDSFFAHLCFFGSLVHEDGNPIEATLENFNAVKNAIDNESKIDYQQGNFIDHLSDSKQEGAYDYIGLSDVPSYFTGDVEKNFLQDIAGSLRVGGVVVLRNYLRIPSCDSNGFEEISNEHKELFLTEGVGVYRFQVYRKKA